VLTVLSWIPFLPYQPWPWA